MRYRIDRSKQSVYIPIILRGVRIVIKNESSIGMYKLGKTALIEPDPGKFTKKIFIRIRLNGPKSASVGYLEKIMSNSYTLSITFKEPIGVSTIDIPGRLSLENLNDENPGPAIVKKYGRIIQTLFVEYD